MRYFCCLNSDYRRSSISRSGVLPAPLWQRTAAARNFRPVYCLGVLPLLMAMKAPLVAQHNSRKTCRGPVREVVGDIQAVADSQVREVAADTRGGSEEARHSTTQFFWLRTK